MTDANATSKKRGRGKVVLLVAAALVLAAGGAGAGLYFAKALVPGDAPKTVERPKLVLRSVDGGSGSAEAGPGEAVPIKEGSVSVPHDRIRVDPSKYEITYVPIEQPFTANLADGSGFIQVSISLATYYDGKVIGNIQRQAVPLRSAVLMILSEQDPMVLATVQGKQQLQRQLTAAINLVLRQKEGFGGIDNVYFNSLVIQ